MTGRRPQHNLHSGIADRHTAGSRRCRSATAALGAMVFGGVTRERIALNESTFWSGAPDETQNNPAAREHLATIRQLLFDGEYRQAVELISQHMLGRSGNYGTHLPVGDLWIDQSFETRGSTRLLSLAESGQRGGNGEFSCRRCALHPRSHRLPCGPGARGEAHGR